MRYLPKVLALIFESSISPIDRKEMHDSIISQLNNLHSSVSTHIDQLHSICQYLFKKALTKPTVMDVTPHSTKLDEILSLEHAVSQFKDPKEALVFLQSISPEDIGHDFKLVAKLNDLIMKQVEKLNEEDEEEDDEQGNAPLDDIPTKNSD